MRETAPYAVIFTPAARRRLAKLLDAPFGQVRSARRGEHGALYTVDEQEHVVTVLAVAHRRDAYRPHK